MTEFLDALRTTPLLLHALLAGLVSCLTFGVVGGFVVVRRIGYIAAAISHSILGGIGAAFFFKRSYGIEWLSPMAGALFAALLSALIIGVVSLRAREREDTIIGAIWTIGMAAGLVFLHYTPGPGVNLDSYIFGNILLTSRSDFHWTLVLSAVVLGTTALLYPKLLAVCFDEEFARLRGVRSGAYYLLLLGLVSVSVVLLVKLTGVILAIALIVLPAATAARLAKRLWTIMLAAVLLSLLYTVSGFAISYGAAMPTGPLIVLIASGVYAAVIVAQMATRRLTARRRIDAAGEPGRKRDLPPS